MSSRIRCLNLLAAIFLTLAVRVYGQVQTGGTKYNVANVAACEEWAGDRCDVECSTHDGCDYFTASFYYGHCSFTGACNGS